MTPGETDTNAHAGIGILDRIAVRSDMANWRMPSPWAIGFGISSGIMAFPVIKVTGSLTIAGILFVLSLVTVVWLIALVIRRAWCERYPYLPPRWLAVAGRPCVTISSMQHWSGCVTPRRAVMTGCCAGAR